MWTLTQRASKPIERRRTATERTMAAGRSANVGGMRSVFGGTRLVSAGFNKSSAGSNKSSVDGDGIHEGDHGNWMPAGEERQRSVPNEDSTRNESRMVFYNRGLSDPGYSL